MTVKEICDDLQKKLKPERFSHTIGVAYTAACLSMCYGEDVNRAYRAGILHDCGKYMDGEASLEFCLKNGIEITETERMKPGALLHAKTGAYIAKNLYKETDEEVIKSILTHTTGDANMSILQKIIFVADFIEPGRKNLPMMDSIRAMAFKDIDVCVKLTYESIIGYIKNGTEGEVVDEKSLKAFEFYNRITQNKYI